VVRGDTAFVARNDAHWTDGTFVYVPRGVTVEQPIVITTAHEQPGSALHWRLLVVLEEDAQASVWHESSSAADGLVNGVVELVVGQSARLRLCARGEGPQPWVAHEPRSGADALVTGVVELVVGQSARLRLVDLQDLEE